MNFDHLTNDQLLMIIAITVNAGNVTDNQWTGIAIALKQRDLLDTILDKLDDATTHTLLASLESQLVS